MSKRIKTQYGNENIQQYEWKHDNEHVFLKNHHVWLKQEIVEYFQHKETEGKIYKNWLI